MEMEQLIDAQYEPYERITCSVDNLHKLGAAKITLDTVQAAKRLLEAKYSKFEEQHDQLLTAFWKRIKDDEYAKEDFPSLVETASSSATSSLSSRKNLPCQWLPLSLRKHRTKRTSLRRHAGLCHESSCRSFLGGSRTGHPFAICSALS